MTAFSWVPPDTYIHQTNSGQTTNLTMMQFMDDFFAKMDMLDWTQTADTGQYVFGTDNLYTSLPDAQSIGASLGFRIYRLDDSLATTFPIYVRVELTRGAGTKTTGVRIGSRITVGTATNGSGVVSGGIAAVDCYAGYSLNGSGTSFPARSYQSFACSAPENGFVGVVFNAGRQDHAYDMWFAPVCFFVERIPNPDGTPSDKGFSLFILNASFNSNNNFNNSGASYTNVGNAKAYTYVYEEDKTYSHTDGIPYFPQTTLFTNKTLLNHFYHSTPGPVRSRCLVALPNSKLGKGSQFEAVTYGATSENFITMDRECAFKPYGSLVVAFKFE